MMHNSVSRNPLLILLMLAASISSCAVNSPPLPPQVVSPPQLPPLPTAARQPTPPEICLPTCSAGLLRLRTTLLDLLTQPLPPEPPASAPTTAPDKP